MSRRGTVLVIEDDEDLARALAELIVVHGIEAVVAKDAPDAINRLRGGLRACAIVLDLGLPGVGGVEFLQIRRSFEPEVGRIPVVVLTGADPRLGDFARLGVVGVFRKPTEISLMVKQILNLCDRR